MLFICLVIIQTLLTSAKISAALEDSPYLSLLLHNKLQQCSSRPEEPRLPRSFYVPPDYFDSIPQNERIPPEHQNKDPEYVNICEGIVQPAALDQYEFDTERFLCSIGLNIYDGALWAIALSKADPSSINEVYRYHQEIIHKGATCQFGNIHADAKCNGVIVKNACQDPTGACGFCYGEGSNEEMTEDREHAWIFRMLSDYWSLDGTVDARCPHKSFTWTWNDYRPVLGENTWSSLLGPLQVAYIRYGSAENIQSDDISINMGLTFLQSLQKMITRNGAVSYSPKNTLGWGKDFGFDVSTENNISVLAGLRMLREILAKKNMHWDKIGELNTLIDKITNYIKDSFDPSLGYFRQGGSYDVVTGQFVWATGPTAFAVDCQTWAMTVISPLLIEQWFGISAKQIWETTKKIGGYQCSTQTGAFLCEGLGFTENSVDQVFSGEWTLGAINMLRVWANEYSDPSFDNEAEYMINAVKQKLVKSDIIEGYNVTGVLYSNKRYWIPFGWWANPVISTVSTSWTLLADAQFNPFFGGGAYKINY